jgi:hypothetical protein
MYPSIKIVVYSLKVGNIHLKQWIKKIIAPSLFKYKTGLKEEWRFEQKNGQ